MDIYAEGLKEAVRLIVTLDFEVFDVLRLSLWVSGCAALLAAGIGIPLGAVIAASRFVGKHLVISIINTFMGLPPVVVGLVVFLTLARHGPLGSFNLLFTPQAMIISQVIIATPIVAGLSYAAIAGIDNRITWQALSLGATKVQVIWTLLREAWPSIIAAFVAGFGRIIAEVGSVMIVGGNIKGQTRVITTFIVEETRRGQWGRSIALGLILIAIAFIVNAMLTLLRRRTAHG